MKNAENRGISVIICCYNSAGRITRTLDHIARLAIPAGFDFELIIVDNNSKDDTHDKVVAHWESLAPGKMLQTVFESRQGLAYARIAGLKTAKYGYIIYCDDDNWLSPDYAIKVADFFDEHQDFGLLGGRSVAVSDVPLPDWFESLRSAYACGQQCFTDREVTGQEFLWGAGISGRKKVFDGIYDNRFPVLFTGRNGETLVSGDDDEINGRTWLLGYRVFYKDDLVLQHFIEPARLNKTYAEKVLQQFSKQGALRGAYARMYRISQMSKLKRWQTSIQVGLSWFTGKLQKSESKQRVAASYLHLLTGSDNFGNALDRLVYRFFKTQQEIF